VVGGSFKSGGALGIAMLSTVAVARAGPGGGSHSMTEGFQAAFAVAVGIALLGALLALLLFRPKAPVASTAAGPAPAPDTVPLERNGESSSAGPGGNPALGGPPWRRAATAWLR